MKIALIVERPVRYDNGTGVQILRILEESSHHEVVGFYFNHKDGNTEIDRAFNFNHWIFDEYFGRRNPLKNQISKICCQFYDSVVFPRRYKKLLREELLEFDVAYVFLIDETRSRWILPLLESIGCPYVVHIMDLFLPDGIIPNKMPALTKMLKQSSSVVVLTENIYDEVMKCELDSEKIHTIRIGQDLLGKRASYLKKDEKIKFVFIGGMYRNGMELLANSWLEIMAAFPNIELHYIGANFGDIPSTLQPYITNHGLIKDKVLLHEKITDCHLAYLNGPSEINCFGRFSYPSRTSDYFMAGLPVLACVGEETATKRILRPLQGNGVYFVNTAKDMIDSMNAVIGEQEKWEKASSNVYAYAVENFNMVHIRERIFGLLSNAAKNDR